MSAFGSITALTAGAATLNATAGQTYFWIGNSATTVLTLTFKDAAGNTLGQWPLNPAAVAGQRGDSLDSVSMPAFLDAAINGSVALSGTGTGAFFSGASMREPTRIVQLPVSGASGVRSS